LLYLLFFCFVLSSDLDDTFMASVSPISRSRLHSLSLVLCTVALNFGLLRAYISTWDFSFIDGLDFSWHTFS